MTTAPPQLTDRKALAARRARAQKNPALFLHERMVLEIEERLTEVNRTFTDSLIVTGWPQVWQSSPLNGAVIADTPVLDQPPASRDLVVHGLCLHWADDPVGQLIQARRILRPDGHFICATFGGETLHELRAALATAEAEVTGGLSPRVAPMGEIRDLGALLQRAGFALPVADSQTVTVTYADPFALMRDLRAMGETNVLAGRLSTPTRRAVLTRAAQIYTDTFGQDGRIPATFEIIMLSGWAPHENQPQPLRPGSAAARLSDALGTQETKLPRSGN